MGALSRANFNKIVYYFRRNGLKNTWYAVRERLAQQKEAPYTYQAPSKEALQLQRESAIDGLKKGIYDGIDFSIVVPLYRTKPEFLQELTDSVRNQSFPAWELILADATEDESVWEYVREYDSVVREEPSKSRNEGGGPKDIQSAQYGVIRYIKLTSNDGISANTNAALPFANMNYIGLLDHDDILTLDALYEMAETIRKARENHTELQLVYSDEDKCNGDATEFFEPHYKEDFNYDLVLTNNYICHFTVMKGELMKKLGFRPEFDGAQDYDLVLRTVSELGISTDPRTEKLIAHVPRVLYHWRCHASSTAENPRSKEYAYEAGRRALQDYWSVNQIKAQVSHLKHVGFYQTKYSSNAFLTRKDIGAIGGPVTYKGRIVGGRMDVSGKVFYEKLPIHFGGYMHRAVLSQTAEVVDIRNIEIREELKGLFEDVVGVPYKCKPGLAVFDASVLPKDADYKKLSRKLCDAIQKAGYRILWCRRENE